MQGAPNRLIKRGLIALGLAMVGLALAWALWPKPVTVEVAELRSGPLAVSVEDEGIGIPDADRALVVEPFHRAWNVRESRIPGTGLGLYIARRLVEAHGGELTIGDRADGRSGTRVRITLPLAKAPARRERTAEVAGSG